MKKNFFKALIGAVVLSLGLSSCGLFGPVCEIKVVNACPYLNDTITAISVKDAAGNSEVDMCKPYYSKGILSWESLPGGYEATYSVYSRVTGAKKVIVYGTIDGVENAEYNVDIEVTELPSEITVKLLREDSTYKFVAVTETPAE